jgi:hypothetical protein
MDRRSPSALAMTGYTVAVGRLELVSLGLALAAAGLIVVFIWPPGGVTMTGAGLALMRWGVTRRRPGLPAPFPAPPGSPGPDRSRDRSDASPPFDLRRPRDVLALAFIGVGIAFVVGVYIAGPVLHPVHVTVPVAFLLIYLMLRRTLSRDDS